MKTKEKYKAPYSQCIAMMAVQCLAQSGNLPAYDENNPGKDTWLFDE